MRRNRRIARNDKIHHQFDVAVRFQSKGGEQTLQIVAMKHGVTVDTEEKQKFEQKKDKKRNTNLILMRESRTAFAPSGEKSATAEKFLIQGCNNIKDRVFCCSDK